MTSLTTEGWKLIEKRGMVTVKHLGVELENKNKKYDF